MFIKYIYHYYLIKRSGLFDKGFYLLTNQDVRDADIDPLWHFVKNGWVEKRDPSALFEINSYLNLNPDVEVQNINPLIHYIKHGQYENRPLKSSNLDDLELGFDGFSSFELFKENALNPPKTLDIIIFPIIDWTFRFQRPQHLALQLASQGHRVFYIKTGFCKGEQPIIKKIRHNIFSIQLANGNLKTQFNTALSENDITNLLISMKILRDLFFINSAVMVVDLPFWADLVIQLKSKHGWKILYDCMDLHMGFSIHSHKVQADERKLLSKSDLVVTTSHYLLNHVKNENTVLIPNGADFCFFHQAKSLIQVDEIKDIPKPIIGYFGAIADWFDTKLIGQLAKDNQNWSFVLIGSTFLADLLPFAGLKNIHLLGEKPYSELPKYLSNFDVCLIPFKRTPLTDATNPVKMYEYLAAGKPIVSTRLDELMYYSHYLHLAESKQDWENLINQCLSEIKTIAVMNQRFDFAKDNTWEQRGLKLRAEIMKLYKKVSIIVVSFNNQPYLELCLDSIVKNTEYPNYEIIIVDNNSDLDTVSYLSVFHKTNGNSKLIFNDENLGFAKANNQGAQIADGEFLVLLNNDTIVTPGWLNRLLWHLESNKDVAMVGPVSNGVSNEARIFIDYTDVSLENINIFASKRSAEFFGQFFEIQMLALFCAIISKDLYMEIGGLDEQYKIGMFEDDDLAMKLNIRGYKLICAEDTFVHHFQRTSFKLLPENKYLEIFNENQKRFENKWQTKWAQHKTRKDTNLRYKEFKYPNQLTNQQFNERILNNAFQYKGVFIQEPNILWNTPLYQRPQHLCTTLGKMGYLVIYRNVYKDKQTLDFFEVSQNVWVTHKDVKFPTNVISSVYSTAFNSAGHVMKRGQSKNVTLIYEYIDHITPEISVDHETANLLRKLKDFAFKHADFVVASARMLEQEAIKAVGSDRVLLIPNGVDVQHFRDPLHQNTELPFQIQKFREKYKIIVGYYGAIAPWLWYGLINKLIRKRDDVGFVFIGPDYQKSLSNFRHSANLLLLEPVDYQLLPGYSRIFDVCIIPFAPGKIAKTTSPLKLFEFFAMEKPVVLTSDMIECTIYDEVFFANSVSSFSKAIDSAYEIKDDIHYKTKLARLADQNSWLERAKVYTKVFDANQGNGIRN